MKKAFNEQTKKLMHQIPDLELIEKLNPIFCLEIIEQYIALIDPTEINSQGGRPELKNNEFQIYFFRIQNFIFQTKNGCIFNV